MGLAKPPKIAKVSLLQGQLFNPAKNALGRRRGAGLLLRSPSWCLSKCAETLKRSSRCVSLIKIIDHAPAAIKYEILSKIILHYPCLAYDPYRHKRRLRLLEFDYYEERLSLKLRNHLLQLSTQKSGSHVVEKCLASTSGRLLLEALASHKMLLQIAQNSNGKYAVNAVLRISKKVVEALRIHFWSLKHHPHRRYIYKNVIDGGGGGTMSPSK
ncbi:unnamed protein product [Spirodela intermedia]|uniref:Uncharacterized protein n=1 Tax=Spirodela intermedia TaxID=51605 RepID=A0A7I8K6Q0_SPIIN|nr:unnamed protein product [Spirodela intermedia]